MSNINAHGSYRRPVSEPETDRVRKVGSDVLKTHVGVNIAGIIKCRAAQSAAVLSDDDRLSKHLKNRPGSLFRRYRSTERKQETNQ